MATGRSVTKHSRFYMDGYDLSGYARNFGPLSWTYDEGDATTLSDTIKNVLPNHPTITISALNGLFDSTATSGIHAVASGAGVIRTVMCPIGIRAAPAIGDPVFCGQFEQLGYVEEGAEDVGVNIPFGGWADDATSLTYDQPWGALIHHNSAATAANSTTGEGVDQIGAASTTGGYMVYQVFSGSGTVTISIDESSDDSSYGALTDATTGAIDAGTVAGGIVALAHDAAVKQYLRWQIAAGGGFSTVTFALAFVRGR